MQAQRKGKFGHQLRRRDNEHRRADHWDAQALEKRRRGAWVLPKYLFGKPTDQLGAWANPRIPFKVRQRMIHTLIRLHVGDPERYGLPKPDHKFGEAHPTVSGRILDRIAPPAAWITRSYAACSAIGPVCPNPEMEQ